jgi:hypothetical protein
MRLFSLFAALILSLTLIACNSMDATKEKLAATAPPPTPAARTTPGDGVRRITTVELRDAMAKGEAVVVDVRSEMAFKEARIKGARLIPVNEVLSKADQLPKDKLIVTYCA